MLKLDVREMELVSVINAGLEGFRPAAEAKGIHVEARLDPDAGPILGDAARLQQVMFNLLSNAVKFTPAGGRVDVRLERRDTRAQITVTDTGEGIAAEFLPHVFERFRQADGSMTRAHGGLGLGLALVRHLVELHGGTVTVDSAGVGQGATFTVMLPIRVGSILATDGEPSEGEEATPGRMVLAGIRVLAVDDDPDARELVAAILQLHGARVTAVASAAEAVEALGRVRPHVLLADLAMPDQDGYSLIQQVRQHEAGRGVPVVALTALAAPADRRRTGEAGFDRHIPKPVEPDELVAAVAQLAGRRAA
jgi:CheY-like chemotaxis protein